MPKIDISSVPVRLGSGYPPPYDAPCATRTSDIDLKSANRDGRFVRKDGSAIAPIA